MKRVIIAGSPRSNGRSAHLAEMLFEACIDECPDDELFLAPVSELEIAPCVACDACKAAGERAAQAKLADAGAPDTPSGGAPGDDADDMASIAYCPRFEDDMLGLYELLAEADELVVVSPVFFSGPPAPMTALLDRLQPFFWEWLALRAAGEAGRQLAALKRSATLHVIGEGLDKNGYVALVSKVRSALAVAGFQLERVLDWVGRIDADGTIIDEAIEYRLPPLGEPLVAPDAYLLPATVGMLGESENPTQEKSASKFVRQQSSRPKLDLSDGGRDGKSAGAKARANGKAEHNGRKNADESSKSDHGKRATGNRGAKPGGNGSRSRSSNGARNSGGARGSSGNSNNNGARGSNSGRGDARNGARSNGGGRSGNGARSSARNSNGARNQKNGKRRG